MKKFPMLDILLKLFIALTIGVIEKICILLYCLLPIGFFMLLMSFRTKNHKATAIGTYTNEKSEFQHIFPNYILVIVEPAWLRRGIEIRINNFQKWVEKYKYLLLTLLALIFLGSIGYLYAYIYFLR